MSAPVAAVPPPAPPARTTPSEHPRPVPSGARRPGRSVLPALASAVVWGTGQCLNRQYLKGAVLLSAFLGTVATELASGHYGAASGGFSPREHGGFLVHGLWGLVTLGTRPRTMGLAGLTEGDHSIVLLMNGIIALAVVLLLAALWVGNVRDAATVGARRARGEHVESSREWVRNLWHASYAYVVLAPPLLVVLFVSVLPIVFGILIAFTSYDRNHVPPAQLVEWVGLANVGRVVAVASWARTFAGVLGWTVVWSVLAALTTYLAGFAQAVVLASHRVRWPRLWRGIFILPWAVPAMISALVLRSMFNGQFGPVSAFLVDIGLTDERVQWFTDPTNPNLARAVALGVNLWLGFPYFMALIGGTLTNVDPSYHEAARLDGASSGQIFRRITFPIVYRATAPLMLLAFVASFNNFGVVYFLTEGGPANPGYQLAGSTDLLITWLYKLTLDSRLYNIGAVMSIIIFVVVGTFSVWNLRRSRALDGADV